MNKIKYLILLFLLFPTITKASNDYTINTCDVEISINSDNNYIYNEIVDFSFAKSNVLVTKELPSNTKDFIIDKDYFIETTDKKLLEIYNNENKELEYNIKYTIKNINNSKNNYEMNLCSNYNNEVKEIDFHINLPSTADSNNITFYLDGKELYDITYQIKDNVLSGTYNNLKEGSVLSVSLNYDAIYYSGYTIACIIIPIIFAAFSALIWYIYGKDLRYKVSRISKLPNSINLMDIALVNDGIVTYEEAYYLLLDLANRGYLEIVENKNNSFTIIRGKEYDGKDYIEASFLKGLFRKTIKVSMSEYIEAISDKKDIKVKEMVNEIPNSDIKDNFKRACINILGLINTNEEKNKYFERKSDDKKVYLIAMVAIILVLVTSLPFIKTNKLYLLPLSVIFSVVTLYILLNFIQSIDLKKTSNKINLLVLLASITLFVMLLPAFKYNRLYIISFLISIVCVSIILFFYKYMPKRTVYGTKVFTKIEGFRLFLEELRDEDLNALLEQQPNYLIDILPVSLILNKEDIVFKKIKERNIKEPSWYKIEDGYTPAKFANSINRLKKKIKYIEEEK